jgi:hypothetical protein
MGREKDDQTTEYEPSMSVIVWLMVGLALWIVALLLFTLL